MEPEQTFTVRHAPASHCYELLDGQTAIGKTEYVPASSPADQERIFYHRNQRRLRRQGPRRRLTIIPVFPYIKSYIRRHPDYQRHAAPIRPEHLAAIGRVYTP